MQPVVGIILGSRSDLPLMESCVKVLDELELTHEVKVCSAHRNPRGVMEWATSARERGLKVVIAAAGARRADRIEGAQRPGQPLLDRPDAGRHSRRHLGHRPIRSDKCRDSGSVDHWP